jgi:leucyl aminopeptidase
MIITITSKQTKGALKIGFSKEVSIHQIAISGNQKGIVIGCKEKVTLFTAPLLLRSIARVAKTIKEPSFEVVLDEWYPLVSHLYTVEVFAEKLAYELTNAGYDFEKYKKDITKQTLFVVSKDKNAVLAATRGVLIASELNQARELINTPGSHLTPADLAAHASREAKGVAGVTVSLLDHLKMKKLNMNAVLAVGESSPNKPKFITMEYAGGKKGDKPFVFVGKGVTFDTGGSNLKPGDHMNGMHMDMAGGAIAIHTLLALAKLKVKKNVVCLVPAVENRVTGDSYLPGDVIIGMSGQAIEVLNTDAEGRVILSDALTYAKKYNPSVVVDLATLTGAAVVALGSRVSALFSNDDELLTQLKTIGENTKNLMWPMPLYDEYKEDIKGDLGGITNTHNKMKRDGGAITGAMFLYQFAKEYKWAHIDIAPRMESITGDNLGSGATAEPLYALVTLVEGK